MLKAATLLQKLERVRSVYGGDASSTKLQLLEALRRRRLPTAGQVLRFHEALCFLRAYPDDPQVLATVEELLHGFARRGDLTRQRRTLADSGLAGTEINFSFFWDTARWLAQRWPDQLSIDWPEFEGSDRLEELLHLLLPFCETPGLDMLSLTPQEWIQRLKGPGETDAAFLIRRFEALRSDDPGRETHYESLDVPIVLAPGDDSPSRTRARYGRSPVAYQTVPLSRARPDLLEAIDRPPRAVRPVSPREGQQLIDLVREAMVTRHRDLYSFSHADKRDVRIVDCGHGLEFVCIGTIPQRRLMLEAVYGFLTLKNGVPIGYVLASSLFGSTEVAYNVFESFRGAEAGYIFGRVMGMVRHLFRSDAFSIDPYQLGHGNEEGLKSGAWWFYYKLGFRPEDPDVLRLLRKELQRMKRDPSHRSSLATLDRLSSTHMFYYLDRPRRETLGSLDLGEVGLAVSRYLADRFGADRETGLRICSREAAQRLGVRTLANFSSGERLAWKRWSPIVMLLPGLERWKPAQRRAMARVIRAKGGKRESDFVRLFDAHPRLRRALTKLA